MPRRLREDHPGFLHHVMNRGIARRPVFEDAQDIRAFLARLAMQVKNNRIQVCAFCAMTTHFHLLLRSVTGELSEAMRLLTNSYVRYFNRRRKRDGALFRGRFMSRVVDTDTYRSAVLEYVLHNPVKARIVESAGAYPYGSAHHIMQGRMPIWHESSLLVPYFRKTDANQAGSDKNHRTGGLSSSTEGMVSLVESRMQYSGNEPDPLDHLVRSSPAQVQEWMRRKVRLADGHQPRIPVVSERSVLAAIEYDSRQTSVWAVVLGGKVRSALPVIRAGLLSNGTGMTIKGVSRITGVTRTTTRRHIREHHELLISSREYAQRAARVMQVALRLDYGECGTDRAVRCPTGV